MNYCCKTMEYMCKDPDGLDENDSEVRFWGEYFTIRYRDKNGNWCGNYQGQYCMWCGKKLDENIKV